MTAEDGGNAELAAPRLPPRRIILGLIALGLLLIGKAVANMPLSPVNAAGVAAALDEARHRGVIRIGVDYVPPQVTPADYETRRPEGFDGIIAADLSKTLGSKVELVALKPGSAAASLNSGEVDMLLTRVGASEKSNGALETVDTGYASGLMPLMRSDTSIAKWSDFSGRTICVSDGNAGAQNAARKSGAEVRILKAPAKSLAEVRTGACDAAIGDEAALRTLLQQADWEKFSATLPAIDPFRLVFAVRAGDRISEKTLKEIAARWSAEDSWSAWTGQWGADVAFEVYLEQDAPDCH